MDDTDNIPATKRFASNSVILRAIGNSRNVLRILCLTNKLFNFEFKVFLYRELDVSIEKIDPENRHLVHTRTLVATSESTLARDPDGFNQTVRRLLAKMYCVESLVWRGRCQLLPATIAMLDLCPLLKGVYHYGHHYGQSGHNTIPPPLPAPNFSGFKNLQWLTLTHLGHDLQRWGFRITQVLQKSPDLKAFELSISTETIYECVR